MARYQVILSYDGSGFAGFQRQRRARSVQAEVENALRKLGWQGRSISSAGRTDTGVHAAGQVIAFDLDWQHPAAELLAALNAQLPLDVAARSLRVALPTFHPRHGALSRRYAYQVFCDPLRNPLRERYAWRVWPEANIAQMRQAAAMLVGTHDFVTLGSPTRPGGTTLRKVLEADWREGEGMLRFEVAANAFLYHMVRRMAFLCVLVGQGRLSLEEFAGILEGKARKPGLAPPQGLILLEVVYLPLDELQDAGRDLRENNTTIVAEGFSKTLAVSGDDNSGQDIRPKRPD